MTTKEGNYTTRDGFRLLLRLIAGVGREMLNHTAREK